MELALSFCKSDASWDNVASKGSRRIRHNPETLKFIVLFPSHPREHVTFSQTSSEFEASEKGAKVWKQLCVLFLQVKWVALE